MTVFSLERYYVFGGTTAKDRQMWANQNQALTARLKAAPFQNRIAVEFFSKLRSPHF